MSVTFLFFFSISPYPTLPYQFITPPLQYYYEMSSSDVNAPLFADAKRELWGLFRKCAAPGQSLASRVLDYPSFERLIYAFDFAKFDVLSDERDWVPRLWNSMLTQEGIASMEIDPTVIRWPTLWKVVKALLSSPRTDSPSPPPVPSAFHSAPLQLHLDTAGLQGILSSPHEPLTQSPPRHSVSVVPNRGLNATPRRDASVLDLKYDESPCVLHAEEEVEDVPVMKGFQKSAAWLELSQPPQREREKERERQVSPSGVPPSWDRWHNESRLEQALEELVQLRTELSASRSQNRSLESALVEEKARRMALLEKGHLPVADALPPQFEKLSQLVRACSGAKDDEGWVPRQNYNKVMEALQMKKEEAKVSVAAYEEKVEVLEGRLAAVEAKGEAEVLAVREEVVMLQSEAQYREEMVEKLQADKARQIHETNTLRVAAQSASENLSIAETDCARLHRELKVARASLTARDIELSAARESILAAEEQCRGIGQGVRLERRGSEPEKEVREIEAREGAPGNASSPCFASRERALVQTRFG